MLTDLINNKKFWWLVFGVAGLIVLVLLIRWLSRIAPKKDLLSSINVNKNNLSYQESQYLLWADQLYGAMDGNGTDENAINAVMAQMKNSDDWNQLVKTYGVRKLTKGFGLITSNEGTLPANLRSELTESEMEKYVNVHLTKFGVKI